MSKENVGTFNLATETVVISESMGVRNISLLLVSGTVTVKGTQQLGARPDDAVTLTAGTPLNLSFDFSIDGLTIDATAGAATMITGR